MEPSGEIHVPKLYFDADVIIAGSASSTGAGHALLRACGSTLLVGITSETAYDEAERNLSKKIPRALDDFRSLMGTAVAVVADPTEDQMDSCRGWASPDDLPHLAVAVHQKCDYLVTFNTRHYFPTTDAPTIIRPANLLMHIRGSLSLMRQSRG
ncbi:MAG: PIN domain-containing protein [Armatimonadetes bacterium]|nr:PIN domain-containing protein [Armatimonadota bacterium]